MDLFEYFRKLYPDSSEVSPDLRRVYEFILSGERRIASGSNIKTNWVPSARKFDKQRKHESNRGLINVHSDIGLRMQSIYDVVCQDMDLDERLRRLTVDQTNGFLLELKRANEFLVTEERGDKNKRGDLLISLPIDTVYIPPEELAGYYERLPMLLIMKANLSKKAGDITSAINTEKKVAEIYGRFEEAPEISRRLAYTYLNLGKLCKDVDDLEGAEKYFILEKNAFENLKTHMDEEKRQKCIAYSLNQLGQILGGKDPQKAAEYLLSELKLLENADWKNANEIELMKSNTYYDLGKICEKKDFHSAIFCFESTIDIIEKMDNAKCENMDIKSLVAHSYGHLARLLKRENPDRAIDSYSLAIGMLNELEGHFDETDRQINLGYCHTNLGDLLIGKNNYEEAKEHKRKGIMIFNGLKGKIDRNIRHLQLLEDYSTMARVSHACGNEYDDMEYLKKVKKTGDALFSYGNITDEDLSNSFYRKAVRTYEYALHVLEKKFPENETIKKSHDRAKKILKHVVNMGSSENKLPTPLI